MSEINDIRIEDHSGEVIEELRRKIPQILTEIGLHLEGEAKQALEDDPRRVDTGLLRNSITFALSGQTPAITSYKSNAKHAKTDKPVSPVITGNYTGTAPNDSDTEQAVYVGTNVEYAPYVHEGTMKMAPNRFIKNAVELNKEQIKEKIKERLSS